MKNLLSATLIFYTIMVQAQRVPTFEEVISLRSVGSVTISPDGKSAIYSATWEVKVGITSCD